MGTKETQRIRTRFSEIATKLMREMWPVAVSVNPNGRDETVFGYFSQILCRKAFSKPVGIFESAINSH